MRSLHILSEDFVWISWRIQTKSIEPLELNIYFQKMKRKQEKNPFHRYFFFVKKLCKLSIILWVFFWFLESLAGKYLNLFNNVRSFFPCFRFKMILFECERNVFISMWVYFTVSWELCKSKDPRRRYLFKMFMLFE